MPKEYKTAEEMLSQDVRPVKDGFYTYPMVTKSKALEAMKAYAEQEIRRHLAIAAERACETVAPVLTVQREAIKKAITSTTIELT